jgi:hypothetical protein
LTQFLADFRMPAFAVHVRDDGREREQHAHQRDEHRKVDARAYAHRSQVERAIAPGHDGVDHAVGHYRQLRD